MTVPPWSRIALVLACLTAGGADRVSAQTADDLFNDGVLHELRLYIHGRDLEALRAHYDANMFYPVDIVWRGLRVSTAGMRSRGLASRDPDKPALWLDFDRFVRGQTFVGLTDLALDNLFTDPAAVRESVSMALFRRLGWAAPREAFARLYINDVYHGVYAIVEAITPQFVASSGFDPHSYLFEKVYVRQYRGEELGSVGTYGQFFEARSRQLESDSVLYGPIRDLFEEVNRDPDSRWRNGVAPHLDLPQFMAYVAVETCLADEDGVLGFAGMANFYLHRSGAGPHRLIPWDKDRTFSRADFPIYERGSENELFKRAIMFDDLKARYLEALEQCAHAAGDAAWLEGEIRRHASVIATAIREDPVKPYSNEAHTVAVTALIQFARQRPGFVVEKVAAARAGQ